MIGELPVQADKRKGMQFKRKQLFVGGSTGILTLRMAA